MELRVDVNAEQAVEGGRYERERGVEDARAHTTLVWHDECLVCVVISIFVLLIFSHRHFEGDQQLLEGTRAMLLSWFRTVVAVRGGNGR